MVSTFFNSMKSGRLELLLPRNMKPILGFLTIHKIQTLFIIFTGFGVLYLVTSVSQLKNKQIYVDSDSVKPNSIKPIYWLSAKNPDSGYMRHVQEAFSRIGYERWDEKFGGWDVMWSYEYPFGKLSTSTLQAHQLVNHFPGSGYLTSKGYLAKSKSKYIPLAFSLPKDVESFKEYAKEHPETLWVQKNNNHRGIKIKSIKELDFDAPDSFIQEFVRNPYLIDGHKFDIGIYTVITSIDPLRIYVLNTEWLIRFCPEKYEPFNPGNRRQYVVEDDYKPTWKMSSLSDGYIRAKLSHKDSLLLHIERSGHDPKKVTQDLYSAVAELVRDKQEKIMNAVSNWPHGTQNFFEMVRFDFVLDANMNVFAMEVNMSPNLSSGHFSDNARMYRQVVSNTLSLVGVTSDRKPRSITNRIENEMDASERDLVAFPQQCVTCKDCQGICSLCHECLSEILKYQLRKAFLEQMNKRNFKRVHPKPLENKKNAKSYDPFEDRTLTTDNDKLIALWYKGKCMDDASWCL